ncbi:MAG TPA: Ig-like domain-containing protein, partial [Saprospiraceae bacterium]|nr:Ig-like domain-containing protein [Saprospiraceae bacterium]
MIFTGSDQTAPTGTPPPSGPPINSCFVDMNTPPLGVPPFNAGFVASFYSDNCGQPVVVTYISTTVTGNNCSWTVDYAYGVTDQCLNPMPTQHWLIHGGDTEAPHWLTLAGVLNGTYECNNFEGIAFAQTLFPVAADNCDNDVSNIVKVSGPFVPSMNCPQSGTYTNTWTVTDACNNTSVVYTQVITVIDDMPPTALQLPHDLDATLECSDGVGLAIAMALAPAFSDNCDTNVPAIAGMTTNTQDPDPNNCGHSNYTITRTWTGTDDCGNTSLTYTQVITIHDTTKPLVNQPPGFFNITLECSDAGGLAAALAQAPTFMDNCDPSVPAVEGIPINTQNPDPNTCGHSNYTITRTWTGTDACGNTSLVYTQVITIHDTTEPMADQPPGFFNVTLECSDGAGLVAAISQAPTFSDNCDPLVPAQEHPPTTTQNPNVDDCGHYNYTITRTWTGTDACGNVSMTYTQVITIHDTTKPVADQGPNALNVTLDCGDGLGLDAALLAAPTFTDNCDPTAPAVILTNVTTQGEDPELCSFYDYTITRTWHATDACGNTSLTYTQVITVHDQSAPEANQLPNDLDVTLECSDGAGLADALDMAPTFSDNCDLTAPAIPGTTVSTKGTDPEQCSYYNYTITRTWTATDACGNTSSTYTQVITIHDTTKPTANQGANALNFTLECSDGPGLVAALAQAPTFTDNCDPTAPTVLQSTVSTQDANPEVCGHYNYTITRTWNATDACGNTSLTYTQVITIHDSTKPTADQPSSFFDVTLECSNGAGLTAALAQAPTFTDNCDPTAPAVLQSTVNTQDPNPEVCGHYNYTITRTWTGTDACGNTSLPYMQVITVHDLTQPVADQMPGALNASVECSDGVGLVTALAA